MTLQEIATALVAGCREGRERANLDKLYAAHAVSVEATSQGGPRESVGIDAIKAKHDWWDNAMETGHVEVEGPFLHGEDRFGAVFRVNAKDKATGKAHAITEIAVYHVADGQIVREEFFYIM